MPPASIFAQTPRLVSFPLASRPHHTAQAAGRRTNPQHDAKKARMKETRLGKRGRGDSHAEGGGACTRPAKKIRPQPAVVLLRRWAVTTPPRPMHKPQLRPHIARRSRCGDGSLSAMFRLGARRGSFFLCGVEQTPVFVWRVVVVGGLCARRREVQIWCGDGPRCGCFT